MQNNVTGPAIQFSTPKPQLLTLKLVTIGHVMLNTVHCNVLGSEMTFICTLSCDLDLMSIHTPHKSIQHPKKP